MDFENKAKNPALNNSERKFKGIMQRSRITEEDLEQFRQQIIATHKKKHYRVLLISAILFICLILLVALLKF
ncbi:hypothetical protein C8P64_1839 [Christiangramia gaetbulicola]|uniref:Uncharacterized protein n=1 Tax=Christiangramia gaetbulicola TaxID=703340 RepID=A0A2T6AHN6_9FLAO|nr:hypothetical protein [Christiangramia gaetbulicola]PTX43312.1 hypothetical protein C8P64_1839 [Christiangramia gaetbulicola]